MANKLSGFLAGTHQITQGESNVRDLDRWQVQRARELSRASKNKGITPNPSAHQAFVHQAHHVWTWWILSCLDKCPISIGRSQVTCLLPCPETCRKHKAATFNLFSPNCYAWKKVWQVWSSCVADAVAESSWPGANCQYLWRSSTVRTHMHTHKARGFLFVASMLLFLIVEPGEQKPDEHWGLE